ncbi:MAG: aldo/keto reductase [Candidatus Bruticola sp.]
MEYTKLNNGLSMPLLGFGLYKVEPSESYRCVSQALEVGYRLLDTAQFYANEAETGRAIAASGLPRRDIFLTTKIWYDHSGYEKARESIKQSLERLQTDYVDLLLIHQPLGDYYGTYRAMEEAYTQGLAKAIGVSNFTPDRLIDLCYFSKVKPMVNQVEAHVFFQQKAARQIMNKYHVQIESWGSLAQGRSDCFTNETLLKIGQTHHKSPAQIALRFLIQSGIVAIPKSSNLSRIAQNFDIFDFDLNKQEIDEIEALDRGVGFSKPANDSQRVEYLLGI